MIVEISFKKLNFIISVYSKKQSDKSLKVKSEESKGHTGASTLMKVDARDGDWIQKYACVGEEGLFCRGYFGPWEDFSNIGSEYITFGGDRSPCKHSKSM